MEVGREVNRVTLLTERGEPVRSGPRSMSRAGVPADQSGRKDQRDQVNHRHRQDHTIERRPSCPCGSCGAAVHDAHFCRRRCKFCKQVHDAGRCKLFTEFERLINFFKSSIDRTTVPEELKRPYSPGQLTRRIADFDWVGKQRLPQSMEPAVDATTC